MLIVIRAWTFMQCIVIIVLKIEPAGTGPI